MKLSILSFLAILAVAVAQNGGDSVHERLMEFRSKSFTHPERSELQAIKDHHNRRMARLQEMIEERRVLVEDHESGRRRLNEEDYSRAERQHKNFQRKLEQMKQKTTDAHFEEQLEEIRSMQNMNRMDYLKFKDDLSK